MSFKIEHTEEAFVDVYMEESETFKSKTMNVEMSITDSALNQYFFNKDANRNIQTLDAFLAEASSRDKTDQMAVSAEISGGGWGFKASAEGDYQEDKSMKSTNNEIKSLLLHADSAKETEGSTQVIINNYDQSESGEMLEYVHITQQKDQKKFNKKF